MIISIEDIEWLRCLPICLVDKNHVNLFSEWKMNIRGFCVSGAQFFKVWYGEDVHIIGMNRLVSGRYTTMVDNALLDRPFFILTEYVYNSQLHVFLPYCLSVHVLETNHFRKL